MRPNFGVQGTFLDFHHDHVEVTARGGISFGEKNSNSGVINSFPHIYSFSYPKKSATRPKMSTSALQRTAVILITFQREYFSEDGKFLESVRSTSDGVAVREAARDPRMD